MNTRKEHDPAFVRKEDAMSNRSRRDFLGATAVTVGGLLVGGGAALANDRAQTVRVEHVTVNEGGQAIVGNITQGGRGSVDR